jgi:hypothetical protein
MNRDPRQMSAEEIVQEIHLLRDSVGKTAHRIVELSQTLYSKVRRTPADDYTARFVLFANTWLRLGAMVEGGIRRTSSTTRIIEGVHREKREAEVHESAKKPKLVPTPPVTLTPLAELYGEEMVNHATAR